MFSTIDSPANRFTKTLLVSNRRAPLSDVLLTPLALPKSGFLAELNREVRTVPEKGRLEALASAVADRPWVTSDPSRRPGPDGTVGLTRFSGQLG